MKKIEAKTLEDAYSKASKEYNCSITDLNCEIVQYPSSGLMGLFSKNAIIVVAQKPAKNNNDQSSTITVHKETATESLKEAKTESSSAKDKENVTKKELVDKATTTSTDKSTVKTLTPNDKTQTTVLDSFFENEKIEDTDNINVDDMSNQSVTVVNNIPLQEEIEKELKSLISKSCFDIDTVEVDVIDDTAYIFIDGDDAALLIGKEGYRYNALSYLISNWLQNRHKLYLKLEIAQFLASQQEMIRSYMEPVIERVNAEGWGRTRPLDGVLVQIALEQLREEFPNKYVAIKRAKSGERYVLINEFNKK